MPEPPPEGLPHEADNIFGVDFWEISDLVGNAPAVLRSPVLKISMNAWTTSHRMHEHVILPCFFGCPGSLGRDSLDHYVYCPELEKFVVNALS